MKLDIADATGVAPTYPVLVHLSVAGPFHGKLILDPDGNRVECDQASFLWHERDAQGNIIALNEEFEYRLGTFAPYVGAIPDPQNPPNLEPVWGTGEALGLVISTVDGLGETTHLSRTFGVHLEPGKPDHFVSNSKLHGGPVDPVFSWWADGWIPQDLPPPQQVPSPLYILNPYFLADAHDNLTFGYSNTAVTGTSPSSSVSLIFGDQLEGAPGGEGDTEANGYLLGFSWTDSPMPQGIYTATISVDYTQDPEWAGGTVTRQINMEFVRGGPATPIRSLFLASSGDYDGYLCWVGGQPGALDPTFPIVVQPGASGLGLPRVLPSSVVGVPDDPPSPLYLAQSPARQVFVIKRHYLPDLDPCDPTTVGTSCETGEADAWVELADSPSFLGAR